MDRVRLAAVTCVAAIVGTQLAIASPATAYVPALQTVTTVSASNSDAMKIVTVSCPPGKSVIGTGFTIDGPPGQISVNRVAPLATSVQVRAVEINGGTKADWWLRAFAVCAASYFNGLQIVSSTTNAGSEAKTGTATCPAGLSTFGAGAAISGTGAGQVVLNSVLPSASGATAEAVETFAGTPEYWALTTYAICAYYVPGLGYHNALTWSDSNDKTAGYTCVQKTPLSAGWEIQSRFPGAVVPAIVMPTLTNGTQVSAQEVGSAVTGSWALLNRTICVAEQPV